MRRPVVATVGLLVGGGIDERLLLMFGKGSRVRLAWVGIGLVGIYVLGDGILIWYKGVVKRLYGWWNRAEKLMSVYRRCK